MPRKTPESEGTTVFLAGCEWACMSSGSVYPRTVQSDLMGWNCGADKRVSCFGKCSSSYFWDGGGLVLIFVWNVNTIRLESPVKLYQPRSPASPADSLPSEPREAGESKVALLLWQQWSIGSDVGRETSNPRSCKWGAVSDFKRRIWIVQLLARLDYQCGGLAWDAFKPTQVKTLIVSGENAWKIAILWVWFFIYLSDSICWFFWLRRAACGFAVPWLDVESSLPAAEAQSPVEPIDRQEVPILLFLNRLLSRLFRHL